MGWLRSQTRLTGAFAEARVAIDHLREGQPALSPPSMREIGQALMSPSLSPVERIKHATEQLSNHSYPATVLTSGQPYPGEDVAVLRVSRPNLLSLSLGDSAKVPLQRKVFALGFPGAALGSEMRPEAGSRVITHSGIIGQRLPLQHGWEGFHMTAAISPGNSGGPVIDADDGTVIGVSVAAHPTAAQHALAIPINLAKKYLDTALQTAGLSLDPGPVTHHWRTGLEAFARQRYADALKEFNMVLCLQSSPQKEASACREFDYTRLTGPAWSTDKPPLDYNRYVWDKAEESAKALRGGNK